MKFTINENNGQILETFTATNFDEFKNAVSHIWKIGGDESMRSFFFDRYQVKALAGTNCLICRV